MDRFGSAQIDVTAFVLPKKQAEEILALAKGDKRIIEDALGLENGLLEVARVS